MKSKYIVSVLLLAFSFSANAVELYEKNINDVGVIKLYVEPYDKSNNKQEYCGDYLCAINGAPFFGSDGALPKEKLLKIVFTVNGVDVVLDSSSMFEPGIHKDNIDRKIQVQHYWGEYYKVTGRFSDGAGSYITQWIVSPHGSVRTILMNYEMFFDLHSELVK